MDGTLTQAIHDFAAIRDTLGLPADVPILEAIDRQPPDQAYATRQQLDRLELDIAAQAIQQPGANQLLSELVERGRKIAILTRNGKQIAHETLNACGLGSFFVDEFVISRDCCDPKPSPAGINLLLDRWGAIPANTVMVGDYYFDLQAGFDAGAWTVHLDVDGRGQWPSITSLRVDSLVALNALI